MELSNTITNTVISSQFLSTLDKPSLIDLLQHKTQLLVSASISKVTDRSYIEKLRAEVQMIQGEIKNR